MKYLIGSLWLLTTPCDSVMQVAPGPRVPGKEKTAYHGPSSRLGSGLELRLPFSECTKAPEGLAVALCSSSLSQRKQSKRDLGAALQSSSSSWPQAGGVT